MSDYAVDNPGGEEQLDPEKDVLKEQVAELQKLVKQMAGQMKQLTTQKPPAQPDQAQKPQGSEMFKNIVRQALTKHGQDPNADNWRGWDALLADVLHEALETKMKDLNEWKENASNAIYGIEDEVGRLDFLTDPANAKLDRSILPELRELYTSKQYWKKPDGHEGDWNGWKAAYKDFSEKMQKFSGQPTQRPPQPKQTLPGMTYPKEPTRVVPGQSENGQQSSKYLEENPDLAEVMQGAGSTAMLGGFVEEE